MSMKNAFTIDLEDWYQGIGIPEKEWGAYEKRIRIGFDKLMNLLARHKVKATFFILGKVIEEHPSIIKEIISGGHEVGCHTYSHNLLYEMNPQSFSEELLKCKKAIASLGAAYTGFRAPFFSVDHRSWWTLDILQKEGFQYDSSIYPGDSKRTGIVGYRKDIHLLENKMWEAPVSTFKLTKFDVGLGGAYFRILPYPLFKYKFRQINKTRSGIFYIHPWELDPGHPYLAGLPSRIRLPHYFNLNSTEKKIEKLLHDFEFIPLIDIINKNI
jgi:polysaccharide deacetylase family protein (PEP-CTERM system associated)